MTWTHHSILDVSLFKYHRLCRDNQRLLCFYDNLYLCFCDDHKRAECFGYDHGLDQCSGCHGGGRCLQGYWMQAKDFICVCPPCRSGRTCLFNAEIFAFTLDQLFVTDLTASDSNIQERTFYLLIIAPLILFLCGMLNNLCCYVTFRRRKCLRNGIGQYLLFMSVVNGINLGVLTARLIHISLHITNLRSDVTLDKIFCKLLSYLLNCTSRTTYYVASLIALERLYITLFLNGRWLKKPHVARRLIAFVIITVFGTGTYEFLFVSSHHVANGEYAALCVIDFPTRNRSTWILIHQIMSIIHTLLPLLINICSTATISYIVIMRRMRLSVSSIGERNILLLISPL